MSVLRDILGNLKDALDQREILIRQGTRAFFQGARMVELLEILVEAHKSEITGLVETHSTPVIRQENPMASVKMMKRNQLSSSRPKMRLAAAAPSNSDAFAIVSGDDDVVTVNGVDANGNVEDISQVATLSALTSSDPTVMTADTIVGMNFSEHSIKAGSVAISVTATFNPAAAPSAIGPFVFTDNVTITAAPPGAPIGLVVTHGTPTVTAA